MVVPLENDFPDPVSRPLLDPDRFHDPAPVIPGVVDPQDLHPCVPGLLVKTDDRIHVVVPHFIVVLPGTRDPMEYPATLRRHLPAKNFLAQAPIPGEADGLDIAAFSFHDRHDQRGSARGRLLQGDGGLELQVVPFPVKRDQPLPQIVHQGSPGDLFVSLESGDLRKTVRREGGDALPTHVVPRPLLHLDGQAQEIRSRIAPVDRVAKVHGEEPLPFVLSPQSGEPLFPPLEVVRLPRFRAEKPLHLFGRKPGRPRKPDISHGSRVSLCNRDKDLSPAVFHVAGHRNGDRPPDKPFLHQQGPHSPFRGGEILLLDGGPALQP